MKLMATALMVSAALVTGAGSAAANSRAVFFDHASGEVRAFPRKTGQAPLTDLLKSFFDGPTAAERDAGAQPFEYGCALFDDNENPAKSPCGFSDIVSKVSVQNGRALIEVKAFPNASASGIWESLDKPLSQIVRQFPNVKSWAFVMGGYEISGGDYGSPCGNMVCFLFSNASPADEEAMKALSNYGVKKLGR